MSKFVYDPAIPSTVKRELVKELKPFEWLVPGWCQEVGVTWNPQGPPDGTIITCASMYEYRKVQLTFYPLFLSEIGDRREHVIHDLLHAFVSVLCDFAFDTIDRLVPHEEAPKFREALLEELRVRNESCVQDLAHCLAGKLP